MMCLLSFDGRSSIIEVMSSQGDHNAFFLPFFAFFCLFFDRNSGKMPFFSEIRYGHPGVTSLVKISFQILFENALQKIEVDLASGEPVSELAPLRITIMYNLARVLEALCDYSEAEHYYSLVLRDRPSYLDCESFLSPLSIGILSCHLYS